MAAIGKTAGIGKLGATVCLNKTGPTITINQRMQYEPLLSFRQTRIRCSVSVDSWDIGFQKALINIIATPSAAFSANN